MYSALYFEYHMGQRQQELRRSLDRARWLAEQPKERSDSCRSRLARRLVTLGLHLDPQASAAPHRAHPVRR
jgi:hypothetical protein